MNTQNNDELRELLCQLCSTEHPVWYAPNELWNKVMRYPDGKETSENYPFVCPTCFIVEADRLGVETKFKLTTDKYEEAKLSTHHTNTIDMIESRLPKKRNTDVGDAYQQTFCGEYNKALDEVTKILQEIKDSE